MMPVLAQAGQWASRCDIYGTIVSCDEIIDAAAASVTDLFTARYPHEKYLILFIVDEHEYGNGSFSYSVIASLHAKRDNQGRLLRFPDIAGHSVGGYNSHPSYAFKRQLLLQAAAEATEDLVSDVTGR